MDLNFGVISIGTQCRVWKQSDDNKQFLKERRCVVVETRCDLYKVDEC